MDGLTFFKIFSLLKREFCGKVLNKLAVFQGSIYLSIYSDRANNFLFRATPEPPAFLWVNEFLGESRSVFENIFQSTINDIYTVNYDRVGVIAVSKRKSSGKLLSYKLIFEITGGYSNFFILDEDGKILYTLSKKSIDPDRDVNLGSKYFLPRVNKKYSLDSFEGAKSTNELLGFYPLTAKYADAIVATYPTFAEGIIEIKRRLATDDKFYINSDKKVIPFCIDDSLQTVHYNEINDFYSERMLKADSYQNLKLEISNSYTSLLKKRKRLLEKLEDELKIAEKYRKYFDEATLLKSNIYKIKGAGLYELDSYSENGDITKINYEIKHDDNPIKIIDKLFSRATKLKRSLPLIEDRIQLIKNEIFGLEEAIFLLIDCNDIDELKNIKAELKSEEKVVSSTKGKRKVGEPFYTFKEDGFTLFLGRNSLSNHRLITHNAIDTDLWFHARLIPSAHLILRIDGGVNLTDDIIILASRLVASFSKKKGDNKVDIDYTQRKYIKKVAGTTLGFVTYDRFSTVTVQPFTKDELKQLFNL